MEGYKFRVCGNGGQHYYSIINDKYLTRFSVPLHPKPLNRKKAPKAKWRRSNLRHFFAGNQAGKGFFYSVNVGFNRFLSK